MSKIPIVIILDLLPIMLWMCRNAAQTQVFEHFMRVQLDDNLKTMTNESNFKKHLFKTFSNMLFTYIFIFSSGPHCKLLGIPVIASANKVYFFTSSLRSASFTLG